MSRVKLIRIIIITLNPSSFRLTSKSVIFSVLGGALSSARKKSRRRYANFSCRGGKKKERERERAVDTRVFATRKRRRRKGRGNPSLRRRRGPFVEEKSARRRSFLPRPLFALVFSLYFVSNLSPYRRIKSIFLSLEKKRQPHRKNKNKNKNNRDPKYIKQKEKK